MHVRPITFPKKCEMTGHRSRWESRPPTTLPPEKQSDSESWRARSPPWAAGALVSPERWAFFPRGSTRWPSTSTVTGGGPSVKGNALLICSLVSFPFHCVSPYVPWSITAIKNNPLVDVRMGQCCVSTRPSGLQAQVSDCWRNSNWFSERWPFVHLNMTLPRKKINREKLRAH